MSLDETERLLEKVKKHLGNRLPPPGAPRRITFIPFSESEDCPPGGDSNKSLRTGKKQDRDYLILRVFATEVQRHVNNNSSSSSNASPGEFKVTQRNLLATFTGLPQSDRQDILNKVASKVPIVVTPEEPLPQDFAITSNDSIEIAGHGSGQLDHIVSQGTQLTAKTVLDRLQEALGNRTRDIEKIKLTSCVSGEKFLDSFINDLKARTGDFNIDASIQGYNGTYFIPRPERALENLDAGNRLVGNVDELRKLRTLYEDRKTLESKLDERIQDLADTPESSFDETTQNTWSSLEVSDTPSEGVSSGESIGEIQAQIDHVNAKIDHLIDNEFSRASLNENRKVMTVRQSIGAASSGNSSELGPAPSLSSSSSAPEPDANSSSSSSLSATSSSSSSSAHQTGARSPRQRH